MPEFEDDDERDLAGSQDGNSDEDGDETMRDIDDEDGDEDGDGDLDNDPDGDGDGEGEGDGDGEGDGEDEDEGESRSGSHASDNEDTAGDGEGSNAVDPSQPTAEQLDASRTAALRAVVRPEMLTASTYDIVPTIAAPQSTSVNAICATFDTRWVFTGGSDGYIRKFNWADSVNNKLALTVAQRHPFVDSVVKAGVLMTYWENYDTKRAPGASTAVTSQALSPVYSLACQSQALWLLSGTASGSIRLQSTRHDEGREIALLEKHTSAVSVLVLSSDERSLLSGSWDKSVLDWDLQTGQVRTTFASRAGQISSIEARPISTVPVPAESGEAVITNGIGSRDQRSSQMNGIESRANSQPPNGESQTTPDSLFGGDGADDDDLFGDSAPGAMTNGGGLEDAFGEEDDTVAQEMVNGAVTDDANEGVAVETDEVLEPEQPHLPETTTQETTDDTTLPNGVSNTAHQPVTNGLPHAEDMEIDSKVQEDMSGETPVTSDSTFLATSIDGPIRVWDRRQATPVARILPRNTPPWCMSACWSPDGNFIYAGRRNNTVEEYDLRKGLKAPERVFRYPNGSGAVTSVRAMPNGRHLVCASHDILRLYDLKETQTHRSTVPFLIVPGHRTGVISQLYVDPSCRYMMSTGGNRGWEGASTEVLLGYEIAALA